MKRSVLSILILLSSYSGLCFAGEHVLLARLESPNVSISATAVEVDIYDSQVARHSSPFSEAGLADNVLGSIRGKAIETTLPTFQAEKSSRIILWDEAKLDGLKRLNLGNGRNMSLMSK